MGTWKMIKGRVSQAMDDITAASNSNSSNSSRHTIVTTATANANIEDCPRKASVAEDRVADGDGASGGFVDEDRHDDDNDDDDDDEATLNSSISDDFNEAAARTNAHGGYGSDQR